MNAAQRTREAIALLVFAALTFAAVASWTLGASARSAERVDESLARLHQAQERLQSTLAAR
jgi:hypothetical protein